jgi:molecular chaperone HscA
MNVLRDLDASPVSGLLSDQAAVREPIAAGASLFNERLDQLTTDDSTGALGRKYLLVIDAGAGTTDFALFEVFSNPRLETHKYALIGSTVRMSRIAGNAVEEALHPLILKACGIDPATGSPSSDEAFALIKTDLASQIRSIKQTLFLQGNCAISLRPNVRGIIQLEELTAEPSYKNLGGELKTACRAILEGLFPKPFIEALRLRNLTMPIDVLLTGGSSALPIVQDLADTTLSIDGAKFKLQKIEPMPGWIQRLPRELADLVARTYPQCAVAIGGSAPELPEELSDLPNPVVPDPPGQRTLERYQVTGVG